MTGHQKVTAVKNAVPTHYASRTVEEFFPGDPAWVSYDGKKALPVTVLENDDRHYTVEAVAPAKQKGLKRFFRLD